MADIPTVVGSLYVDVHGKAGSPTALLWPSLFTDHSMWRDQVSALVELGWHTISIDPPGHGRSPGLGRRFTMDECADAVLQVLDALGVDEPILFLGTSWGGFVAPRVSQRASERVRGMVLFATSADRPTWFERSRATLLTKLFALRGFDRILNRMIASLMLAPTTKRDRPEIGADIVRRLRSWDRRGTNRTIRSVLVDRNSILESLPAVTAPALVVSGAEDHLFSSDHAKRIAERMRDARQVQVADAAHLIPLEKAGEANALIAEFIERLRAK